jgi:hypothetical protein
LIQDLMQTAGPMLGVAATAIGSAYTGLKGIVGWGRTSRLSSVPKNPLLPFSN